LLISTGSVILNSIIPVWPFLFTPQMFFVIESNLGFIGIKTNKNHIMNINLMKCDINGFIGLKIDSILFGTMLVGYVKNIKAEGKIL
jgi:hypothetical protein